MTAISMRPGQRKDNGLCCHCNCTTRSTIINKYKTICIWKLESLLLFYQPLFSSNLFPLWLKWFGTFSSHTEYSWSYFCLVRDTWTTRQKKLFLSHSNGCDCIASHVESAPFAHFSFLMEILMWWWLMV